MDEYQGKLKQFIVDERQRRETSRARTLEIALEENERAMLRLNQELLQETTLRIRSERSADELQETVSNLTDQLIRTEEYLDGHVARPRRIGKRTRPPETSSETHSGRRVSSRTRIAEEGPPLTTRGELSDPTPVQRRGSRARGTAK